MSAWNYYYYVAGQHQSPYGFSFPAGAQQYPPGFSPNSHIGQRAPDYGPKQGQAQQTSSQPINIPGANPSGLLGNQHGNLGFTSTGTPQQSPQFSGYMAWGCQQPYTAPR